MASVTVTGGQTSSGLTVGGYSQLTVSSGGTAIATTVYNNGMLAIRDGGAVSATVVSTGGIAIVAGTDVGGRVSAGGFLAAEGPDALLSNTTASGNGAEIDVSWGTATGLVLSDNAFGKVDFLGSAAGTTLLTFAQLLVSGGLASDTVVSNGTMSVRSASVRSSGTYAGFSSPGRAIDTTVIHGGMIILGGGTDTRTSLASGTTETVGTGGVAQDAIVSGGARQSIMSGGAARGTHVLSGGVIALLGTSAGASDIVLDQGATLDLPQLSFGAAQAGFDAATHELTVTGGGASYRLTLAGGLYPGGAFQPVHDVGSGTQIVADVAPCFARGTRLLTAGGVVRVEALRIGDVMITAAGGRTPVRWLGIRRLDCRRHRAPGHVHPVRIAAGAVADGVPLRDLYLSPDHAVFVAGALIPIKHLINGRSIAQIAVDRVEYWHVELARHDLLRAEGLACESYLDTGNRAAFGNGGRHVQLHPDFGPSSWDQACAPLVEAGPRLVAIKRRLFERAGAVPPVPRPALRVSVGANDLVPACRADGLWRYEVPPDARRLALMSPAWMPAACQAGSLDRRILGVRLFAIAVDGVRLDLGSADLRGFHPLEVTAEGGSRWTSGQAEIKLPRKTEIVDLAVGDNAVPLLQHG